MEIWRMLKKSHGFPKTFKAEEDRDLNIKHLDGGSLALDSEHDPFQESHRNILQLIIILRSWTGWEISLFHKSCLFHYLGPSLSSSIWDGVLIGPGEHWTVPGLWSQYPTSDLNSREFGTDSFLPVLKADCLQGFLEKIPSATCTKLNPEGSVRMFWPWYCSE